MESNSLKDYIKRAMDLEIYICAQDLLMKEYKKIVEAQCPVAPKLMVTIKPTKPIEPKEPEERIVIINWIIKIAIVLNLILPFAVRNYFKGFHSFLTIFLPIIMLSLYYKKLTKEEYATEAKKYPVLLNEYEHNLVSCNKKDIELENDYNEKMKDYKSELAVYKEKKDRIEKIQFETQKNLMQALDNHYKQNIIFPKYRNLIAVSAFHDYLASGRCDSLEGANGAYNLYETEIRQNVIITQLSLILNNMGSIKDNQYSLYQELYKSNEEINEIVYEIRELRSDTKMLAYLNSGMALALAANI